VMPVGIVTVALLPFHLTSMVDWAFNDNENVNDNENENQNQNQNENANQDIDGKTFLIIPLTSYLTYTFLCEPLAIFTM